MLTYLEEQSVRWHELAVVVAGVGLALLVLKDYMAAWHWRHPRRGPRRGRHAPGAH